MSARRTCQVLQDPLAEDELLVGRFGGHHHCLHHRPVVQRVDQRFRLRHLPLGFGERRVLGEVCFKPFQGQAGMGAQCCSQSPRPQTPRDAFPRSEPSPSGSPPISSASQKLRPTRSFRTPTPRLARQDPARKAPRPRGRSSRAAPLGSPPRPRGHGPANAAPRGAVPSVPASPPTNPTPSASSNQYPALRVKLRSRAPSHAPRLHALRPGPRSRAPQRPRRQESAHRAFRRPPP